MILYVSTLLHPSRAEEWNHYGPVWYQARVLSHLPPFPAAATPGAVVAASMAGRRPPPPPPLSSFPPLTSPSSYAAALAARLPPPLPLGSGEFQQPPPHLPLGAGVAVAAAARAAAVAAVTIEGAAGANLQLPPPLPLADPVGDGLQPSSGADAAAACREDPNPHTPDAATHSSLPPPSPGVCVVAASMGVGAGSHLPPLGLSLGLPPPRLGYLAGVAGLADTLDLATAGLAGPAGLAASADLAAVALAGGGPARAIGASVAAPQPAVHTLSPLWGRPLLTAGGQHLSDGAASADAALAYVLPAAKTAAAVAQECVRTTTLAWEYERTAEDVVVGRVAEAERSLLLDAGHHHPPH